MLQNMKNSIFLEKINFDHIYTGRRRKKEKKKKAKTHGEWESGKKQRGLTTALVLHLCYVLV